MHEFEHIRFKQAHLTWYWMFNLSCWIFYIRRWLVAHGCSNSSIFIKVCSVIFKCCKTFISAFLNLFPLCSRSGGPDLISVVLHTAIPGRHVRKMLLSVRGQELNFTRSSPCFKRSNLSFNLVCSFTSQKTYLQAKGWMQGNSNSLRTTSRPCTWNPLSLYTWLLDIHPKQELSSFSSLAYSD